MRRLPILLLSLFLSLAVQAADVRLEWTASKTPNTTSVFYAHTNLLSQATLTNAFYVMDVGTRVGVQMKTLTSGRWYFAVVARKDGLDSSPAFISVEVPAIVTQLRATIATEKSIGTKGNAPGSPTRKP